MKRKKFHGAEDLKIYAKRLIKRVTVLLEAE